MAPSIRAGDSVVTIGPPTDQLKIGSILLVRDGERRLLHRLRRMSGEQLWMQGDASLSGDSRPVQRSDVLGQLALVIPTSHLFRAIRTAASFTASLPVSVSLKSSGGRGGAGCALHLRRRCAREAPSWRLRTLEHHPLRMWRKWFPLCGNICSANRSCWFCGTPPANGQRWGRLTGTRTRAAYRNEVSRNCRRCMDGDE